MTPRISDLTKPFGSFSKAKRLLVMGLLTLSPPAAQAASLTFDQMIGAPDGNNLLGATANQNTIYFRDVATENGQTVDARITSTITGETNFGDQQDPTAPNYFGDAGFIPDYRNSSRGPQDDLGFLYYGNGINEEENGLTMRFEFFDGTGDLSGSFITPMMLQTLDIAVYDVDGEASQSEYFSAFKSDGLVSYATGFSPQALVATDQGDSILFDGPGTNFSESDATGAAILYYELTDAISLSFGSVQTSGASQNGVFSAIDGDLSMFDINGFGDPVSVSTVPAPASVFLLLTALAGTIAVSKRRRSGCNV